MLTLIIALLLSVDAFAVGITYGIKKTRISIMSVCIIALCSVVGGYISVFLGTRIAAVFPPKIGSLIGSGILFLIGLWFLVQNILPQPDITEKKTLAELAVKSLGITITIVRNPLSMDLDKSGSIDATEAIATGIALAVDTAGVGLGLGIASSAGYFLPVLIGISEILFIKSGFCVGTRLGCITGRFGVLSGILPGIIMIVIAFFKLSAL